MLSGWQDLRTIQTGGCRTSRHPGMSQDTDSEARSGWTGDSEVMLLPIVVRVDFCVPTPSTFLPPHDRRLESDLRSSQPAEAHGPRDH
jgi:hypothetical protein